MSALGMPHSMEHINDEQCFCKEFCFSRHAVRLKGTREVIYNDLGCRFPSSVYRRKNVVSTLRRRDAVKPIANAVCTPYAHNPTRQPCLAILCVEFLTSFTTLFRSARVFHVLVLQIRVLWAVSYFRHTITGPRLKLNVNKSRKYIA